MSPNASVSLTRSNGTAGRPNAYTTALWPPALNPLGYGIARVPHGPAHGYPREQDEADDEEDHERDDRVPITSRQLVGQSEQQRAEPAHPAVAHLVRGEVLGLLAARHEVREQGARQRLAAAQDQSDARGEDEEPHGRAGGQEVPGGEGERPGDE